MGYQPTKEELQFVYKMILDGSSNREILEEYARQIRAGELVFPLRSDDRFIKARRREVEAASAVLEEHVRRRVDPIVSQMRGQHFSELSGIARALLNNGLADIEPVTLDENPKRLSYAIVNGVEIEESFGIEGLRIRLKDNLNATCTSFGNWKVMGCFSLHVKAEQPDFVTHDIQSIIEEKPFEFTILLRLLATRGTFVGVCPVCRDW